jgi:hypothetical protein
MEPLEATRLPGKQVRYSIGFRFTRNPKNFVPVSLSMKLAMKKAGVMRTWTSRSSPACRHGLTPAPPSHLDDLRRDIAAGRCARNLVSGKIDSFRGCEVFREISLVLSIARHAWFTRLKRAGTRDFHGLAIQRFDSISCIFGSEDCSGRNHAVMGEEIATPDLQLLDTPLKAPPNMGSFNAP